MFGLRFLGHGLQQTATWHILRRFAPRLRFWEWVRMASGGSVLSAVVPLAGFGLKATYLHQTHDVKWSRTTGGLLYLNAVRLIISGGLALGGIAIYLHLGGTVAPWAWGTALITSALGIGVLLTPRISFIVWPKRLRKIEALKDVHQTIRETALITSLLCLLRGIVAFIAFGLVFAALVPEGPAFWAGGTVTHLSALLKLTKLTPGNLGVIEVAGGVFGQWFGYVGLAGLTTAAISRIIGYAAMLTLALAALLFDRRHPPSD